MNFRSALAAVAVLELVTLLALGHYSHQLHQLQGKRSLLASKASATPSVDAASSSSSVPGAGAANQSAVRAFPARPEAGAKPGGVALTEAQLKQQQVQEGIRQLEQQIQQQQLLIAKQQQQQQQQQQQLAPVSAAAVPAAKTASTDGDEDDQDADDDADGTEDGAPDTVSSMQSSPAVAHSPQQPASALGSGAAGGADAPAQRVRVHGEGEYAVLWHDGSLHVRQFALKDSAFAFYDTLDSQTAHRLTFQGVEVKRHVWGDDPWPSEWIPASSSTTSSSSASASSLYPLPAQSAAASPYAGTSGVVVVGGSAGVVSAGAASISMLGGRGWGMGLGGVEGGPAAAMPAAAAGGPLAWGLDRYQGMNPDGGHMGDGGHKGVASQVSAVGAGVGTGGWGGQTNDLFRVKPPVPPVSTRQASLASMLGGAAPGEGGGRAGGDGGAVGAAGVDGREAGVGGGGVGGGAGGLGGGVGRGGGGEGGDWRTERPDAATVGKIHRALPGQYVKRVEVKMGGGDMASSEDVTISTHLSCDRLDRLEAYFRRWQV